MSHLQENQGWKFPKFPKKLRDLLETFNDNPQDVDLYHWDYDEESATMVDLSMKDFTEKGLEEFRVVLDMEVVKIKPMGDNWVAIWVQGAHHSHVESLSTAHAGYCSVDNYNMWFTMDKEEAI